MLVLSLIGVADEDIALDYSLTEEGLGEGMAQVMRNDIVTMAGLGEDFLSARRETCLSILSYIKEKYEGTEAYLTGCGFGPDMQMVMRSQLLEDGE